MMKTGITISMAVVVLLPLTNSSVDAFQDLNVRTTREKAEYEDALAQTLRARVRGRHAEDPLAEATKKLKEADDDDQRDEAMDQIRAELEKQYDQFLAANEQQIEDLQQRLDDLRDQLERRRKAKSKMVDLEVERVINESEGLIWPRRPGRRVGFGVPLGLPAGIYNEEPFWRVAPAPEFPQPPPTPTEPAFPRRTR